MLHPLKGVPRLMAYLLYGAGLRLLECCRLRLPDVDFAANHIVPAAVKTALARHLRSSTGVTFSATPAGSNYLRP